MSRIAGAQHNQMMHQMLRACQLPTALSPTSMTLRVSLIVLQILWTLIKPNFCALLLSASLSLVSMLELLACVRYVPLGLAQWFKGVGVQNVHEMGWWQEAQVPHSSVTLACVPAMVRCLNHISSTCFQHCNDSNEMLSFP